MTVRTEQEREIFSHWIATAVPFDKNVGMVEHSIKTDAAWQGWMARAASQDLHENLQQSEGIRAVLIRLLVQCDSILSTLEGENSDEQQELDDLRRAIAAATTPHRPEEADLLSVQACLGA